MKNTYIILAIKISAFLVAFIGNAQEDFNSESSKTHSKFSVLAHGGIGFGVLESDNQPNYNLNSNYAEVLLNYSISKKFGIATGLGFNELSGNGFNTEGNFYHQRSLLKIPLVLTSEVEVADKIKSLLNFGVYTQYIMDEKYSYLNNSVENLYDNWNFGLQIGIGLVFAVTEKMDLGINYQWQSDFSKFKTSNNQIFDDKQKLSNLNTLGLMVVFHL